MTVSICNINLISGSWDWTNQTLTSSWHRRDGEHYPAQRNLPGSYTSSVSATIIPRLYCGNWKTKASGDFFSVAATKNVFFFFFFFFSPLYLKVMCNIVRESIYWERRTKISPNYFQIHSIQSLKLGLEDLPRISYSNDVQRMSLKRPYMVYKAEKHPWDKDFCMNVILLKLSPQHNRLTIRKEGIRITWFKLNSKTYIIFSSNILSNSIWSIQI